MLVGLCSVPGSREFIESSYTEKTRCNYLLHLFYPVLGKSAGNDEGGALGWHVAAPSGRDSRSELQNFARGGKGPDATDFPPLAKGG